MLACLGALFSSTPCAEAPSIAEPLPPIAISEESGLEEIKELAGEEVPVPQEAFVDARYACREARTLYNRLIADATQQAPGQWLAGLGSSNYVIIAGWYETEGRGLYIKLQDGATPIVSFFDGNELDGYVDMTTVGENSPYRSTDVWDSVFYNWALENILESLEGRGDAMDDQELLNFAREWYSAQW